MSREFLKRTGLKVVESGMEAIDLPSGSFDCAFCLSVIEHLPPDIASRGMQEIARILKPGGRALITVDVNLLTEISRPLDLVWDSELLPLGELDLRWPEKRFGIFCDGCQPADVFGMTLIKDDSPVEMQYSGEGGATDSSRIAHSEVPRHRRRMPTTVPHPLWRRVASRVKRILFAPFRHGS